MDPLSVIASTATVIHVLHRLGEYADAAYKSEAEKKDFKSEISNLELSLTQLQNQADKARVNPNDPRYRNFLLALGPSKQPDGKPRSHASGNKPGALEGLKTGLEKLELELAPGHGPKGWSQRLLWAHHRKKFQEAIPEINTWTRRVDSILKLDVAIDTSDEVRDVNHRVRFLEDRARKDDKNALLTWLSPLKFRDRQADLLNRLQRDPSASDFLTSEEFRLWKEGRPWILHGQGKPGSGKVCTRAPRQLP